MVKARDVKELMAMELNLLDKIPLKWYGGKFYMRNHIIPLMPPHKVYVELFGGSAVILFFKPPAQYEVYNDINNFLYSFFKTLRDNVSELKEQLLLSPCSREDYEKACEIILSGKADNLSDLEKARLIFIATNWSSVGYPNKWLFNSSFKGLKIIKSYYNKIDVFEAFSQRLKNVIIENRSFEKIVEQYDNEKTLFYADPPYLEKIGNQRVETKYVDNLTDEQHKLLIKLATTTKGMWIISHYDCEVYDELLKYGFKKKVYNRTIMANRVSYKQHKVVKEALYMSPNATTTLFLTNK